MIGFRRSSRRLESPMHIMQYDTILSFYTELPGLAGDVAHPAGIPQHVVNLEHRRTKRLRCIMKLVLVLSLLVFLGCSSISVSSDYEESTDFSELKTFAWMLKTPEGNIDLGVVNPLVRSRIQDAIATELASQGYLQIIDGAADFQVTYHARTQEKIEVQPMPGPMIRPRWGTGYADVYQYEEGTLIIDLIHAKMQHLIWRGIAKGSVDWQESHEQRTKLIDEAVQKILAQFPPKRSR